jgi:Leucine-rich repeat (LRR) protein
LTTLNLYGNRLDNVQGIRNLTNLITLNLSSNNLTNLSNLEGIENLTNLKHLDFSYNTLLVQSLGKGGCYGLLKEDDAIKQLQAELLKYFNILKYFLLKNTNIPNIDISKDVVNYIFTMYVSTEKYQINFHNGYYKKKY